jgi:hypothetical protein
VLRVEKHFNRHKDMVCGEPQYAAGQQVTFRESPIRQQAQLIYDCMLQSEERAVTGGCSEQLC